jgi:hypothetical protein
MKNNKGRTNLGHIHVWVWHETSTVFATNIGYFECRCGAKKDGFQPWGFIPKKEAFDKTKK